MMAVMHRVHTMNPMLAMTALVAGCISAAGYHKMTLLESFVDMPMRRDSDFANDNGVVTSTCIAFLSASLYLRVKLQASLPHVLLLTLPIVTY